MIVREASSKQRDINNRIQQEREQAKEKKTLHKMATEEDDDIDPRDPVGSFKAIMDKINTQEPFNLDSYSVFGHSLYSYKEKYYK